MKWAERISLWVIGLCVIFSHYMIHKTNQEIVKTNENLILMTKVIAEQEKSQKYLQFRIELLQARFEQRELDPKFRFDAPEHLWERKN